MINGNNPERFALIDLHLHLDGSLDLSTVRELIVMQGEACEKSDKELRERLVYSGEKRSLEDYLTKFAFPISLLQTEEALALAARRLCERLSADGLIYAEIRFAPQLHTERGLTQSEACAAVIRGIRESGFDAGLILCAMRGEAVSEINLETVRVASEHLGKGVVALDLAGAEALYPTRSFQRLFAMASELGVPYTIHAGESLGADSVAEAIDLNPRRIGHGVRSAEDPEVLLALNSSGIALELCPTSNLNTGLFESLSDYPIKVLLALGIKVTINSDNMTVSATSIKDEYRRVAEECELTDGELYTVLMNSIDAAFAPEEKKDKLRTIAKGLW